MNRNLAKSKYFFTTWALYLHNMKNEVAAKILFTLLGMFIAYEFIFVIDVFDAYGVGQFLFEKEYVEACKINRLCYFYMCCTR